MSEIQFHRRPYGISSSVEFRATPAEVWAVLTDFQAWAEWNPAFVSSSGRAEVGARLVNVARTDDHGGTFTIRPTVRVADPGVELTWEGHLYVRGLFDGRHSFTIERLGGGRVRLTQAEQFRGVLVPLLRRRLERDTAPQFPAFNHALVARVTELRNARRRTQQIS